MREVRIGQAFRMELHFIVTLVGTVGQEDPSIKQFLNHLIETLDGADGGYDQMHCCSKSLGYSYFPRHDRCQMRHIGTQVHPKGAKNRVAAPKNQLKTSSLAVPQHYSHDSSMCLSLERRVRAEHTFLCRG